MLIIKSTAKFSLGNFYYPPDVISNNKSRLWITLTPFFALFCFFKILS